MSLGQIHSPKAEVASMVVSNRHPESLMLDAVKVRKCYSVL